MLPATTRVLVVGAGPVGLAAAVVLRHLGHEVTVVDSQAEAANTSRAAVVHPRTLELLSPYGVVEEMVERGVHTPRFTVRDRDAILVPAPFSNLPTDYPYALMLSQADTEAYLLARLRELGGEVVRPATVERLDREADGVIATFEDGRQVRAEYVVGADGMHSTVREQSGISFTGDTVSQSFSLADVRLGSGVSGRDVILYFSPAGTLVFVPLPDGLHRVVATVAEAPEHPDVPFVQRLLDARGPKRRPAVVEEVIWGSRFRVHERLADSFRVGRILLAGDAAHVHSPAGGQGMNLGLDDAVHLGRALAQVLDGASDAVLETYSDVQLPKARHVIRLAGRLTSLATVPGAARPVRNIALSLAGRMPALQRTLARQLAGLDRPDRAP
ncbi:FAD-dependent oxidoreductase [Brachybacterium sp. GCM10030267]|uniref:FAD-dependent oxidoreductase n=1 Tax=unclassified Brachybacterium TaxID=2623841 RepID=UPI00360F01ED